jgi:hypothetical protein
MKLSPAVVSTVTVPGSLLSQYKLLRAVIDAPWATRLDLKITSHIIDMHYAKFGNARVSLSYLQKATGATPTNIVESLRRIIENGVISVVRKGAGTRPTAYGVNFDFSSKTNIGSVGETSSPPVHGSTSPPVHGSTTASSPPVHGSESYLRNMPTGMLTVSRNEGTPAVPTAPPVSGLALQLLFLRGSESMGNHDSKIVDAGSVD